MADENWYYAAGGQQLGPVPVATLRGMLSTGQLQADDLVWREGMANWTAARATPEFAASVAPVPVARPHQQHQPQHQQPQALGGEWHYAHHGQQQGPVPGATLIQLLATGQISAESPIWRDGMADWQPAHSVPEVARAFATASASAAPVPVAGYYGGATGQVNYYTPGTGPRPYAGFWLRFCAAFLDGLILLVPIVLIGVGMFFALGIEDEINSGGRGPSGGAILFDLGIRGIAIVLSWLYYAYQESGTHMATFGKRAVGIVVTDLQGQRISFGRASGRFFGKIVSQLICWIGYIMAGLTERKQGLHDMMASTLVVRRA